MTELSESAVDAVQSVGEGDLARFEAAVSRIEASGWDDEQPSITQTFVNALTSVLGDQPNVGDIVLLSQALFPVTRLVLNASVYDIEFLIRGYAGAAILARDIPRNIAMVMQLAIIGALPSCRDVELGGPAFDRI